MRFVIPGTPIPQCRPRFFVKHGKTIAYDPLSAKKKAVQELIKQQYSEALDDENRQIAIEASSLASADFFYVALTFFMPIPERSTEAKRTTKLWHLEKHTSKPDLDNLEKFYLDCLTGMIFNDDSQVVRLASKKVYSVYPRTEIEIMGEKNSLSNQVNGILSLFGPDKLMQFLSDAWELYDLYGRDEDGDWVYDEVGDDVDHVRLARTAYLLSRLADKSHKSFAKIHRQYPDFHMQAEKVAKSINGTDFA